MLYFLTGLGHTVLWLSVQLLNLLNKPHKPQLKMYSAQVFWCSLWQVCKKEALVCLLCWGKKKFQTFGLFLVLTHFAQSWLKVTGCVILYQFEFIVKSTLNAMKVKSNTLHCMIFHFNMLKRFDQWKTSENRQLHKVFAESCLKVYRQLVSVWKVGNM